MDLSFRNLSANNFKGRIPMELGHIINLDTLYVPLFFLQESVYYFWIAENDRLFINFRDLSSNYFSGTVPASIGDLEHLLTL